MSGDEFDPEESAGQQRFYGFEEDVSDIHVPVEIPILPLRGVVLFPSAIAHRWTVPSSLHENKKSPRG